ncbi:MAG: hypothetical protein ACLGPM_05055 [Acidobacteriota bacterium]
MALRRILRSFSPWAAVLSLLLCPFLASAQAPPSSSSSSSGSQAEYAQVKAPSLIDPAGPTVSLISAEPVFVMAAALNACGYNEGLANSDPVRKRVRDEMNQALAQSEQARKERDALCLFVAQHNMTGTARDVGQYISLSLYLTAPPQLEITAEPTQMPPDANQVLGVVPILRAFAAAVDLHGIWLTVHHFYDDDIDLLHDPLSKMIVATDSYLKMTAAAYGGRRFIVVVEPMLSPGTVNARIYGTDYVVVVSPSDGKIRMSDVRHIYLHYRIDPLLYARVKAIDRENPILKELVYSPLSYQYLSDPVPFTVECLIKAIEARTMDTGIAPYKIPAGVSRSELPRYEEAQRRTLQQMEAARRAAVQHDLAQGFVLTEYFYKQMLTFEKEPDSLADVIGEMVYSIDISSIVHLARTIQFDHQSDQEVLGRSQTRKLTGLDLAEAKLSNGDVAGAAAMARQVLAQPATTPEAVAAAARAHFIMARVDLLTGKPDQAVDDFQQTLDTSKQPREVSWSHIYLGRILDVECNREGALAEYKQAMASRDGQEDTRLAAERGLKGPYTIKGQSCDEESGDATPPQTGPGTKAQGAPAAGGAAKPQQ